MGAALFTLSAAEELCMALLGNYCLRSQPSRLSEKQKQNQHTTNRGVCVCVICMFVCVHTRLSSLRERNDLGEMTINAGKIKSNKIKALQNLNETNWVRDNNVSWTSKDMYGVFVAVVLVLVLQDRVSQ